MVTFFFSRIYISPCFQARDQTKRLTLIVLLAVLMVAFLTLIITGLLTLTTYKGEVKGESSFSPNSLHYGIVIDCGSSGSRIYVYFWPPHSGNPQDLLNIQQLLDDEHKPVVKKISPGNYMFRNFSTDNLSLSKWKGFFPKVWRFFSYVLSLLIHNFHWEILSLFLL